MFETFLPKLLRDADMHSAYLLRLGGWLSSHAGIVSKRLSLS